MQNGKWGFLNLQNEWVIPPKFNEKIFDINDFHEGLAKICKHDQENSCGYIDARGEIIIPQIYDEYSGDFHEGLATTTIDGKLNYLNKNGQIAFKSDWNSTSDGNFSFGVASVFKNCSQFDDYGVCENYLINTKGENILPKNTEIVRSFPEDNYTVVKHQKTGKLGVVNNLGEIIVPVEFSDIGNFEGPFDWISVSNYNDDQYELTGFYNRKGQKMTDCIYSICGSYYEENDPNGENFICIERQNGEGRGALNKNGKETIPPDYENIDLADQVFAVSKLDRKLTIGGIYNPSCGYIDLRGNILIPLNYKSCSKFNNDFAVVFDKAGWKIINKKNEIIKDLANEYKSVSQFSNGLSNVENSEKFGLINLKGELAIPLIYDYIYNYNDVIQVRIKDKYGIINAEGKIIVPVAFEDTSLSTCNGKVYGKNGNDYFWYNTDGKKLNDRIPRDQCLE